jgi:hypothetical protein
MLGVTTCARQVHNPAGCTDKIFDVTVCHKSDAAYIAVDRTYIDPRLTTSETNYECSHSRVSSHGIPYHFISRVGVSILLIIVYARLGIGTFFHRY